MSYMLQVRLTDQDKWHPPEPFDRKRERDKSEQMMRIIGGFRTRTWQETKAEERARPAKEEIAEQDAAGKK